jgi:signal peptidase I
MLIFLIIISSLIAVISLQILIFALALHLLIKLFKVKTSNFRIALKVISIYFFILIVFAISVFIIRFYIIPDSTEVIYVALLILFILVSFISLLVLLKKYYEPSLLILIIIFLLFNLFEIGFSYLLTPAVSYFHSNLFEPFTAATESMSPTIEPGDYLLIKKFNNQYKRGDIILAKGATIGLKADFIKRIIALPNEHIKIQDGEILIDDKILRIKYIKGNISGNVDLVLKEDEYFVLGDNIEKSYDSRHFGPIKKDDILGKVIWGFRIKELKVLDLY